MFQTFVTESSLTKGYLNKHLVLLIDKHPVMNDLAAQNCQETNHICNIGYLLCTAILFKALSTGLVKVGLFSSFRILQMTLYLYISCVSVNVTKIFVCIMLTSLNHSLAIFTVITYIVNYLSS